MAQIYSRAYAKEAKFSRREQLIMIEIDKDSIDTASSFVEYLKDNYGFSRSSSWYCLNNLKEQGVVAFANKDEMGKPLSLTKTGLEALSKLNTSRNELITHFSSSFMKEIQEKEAMPIYSMNLRTRNNASYR